MVRKTAVLLLWCITTNVFAAWYVVPSVLFQNFKTRSLSYRGITPAVYLGYELTPDFYMFNPEIFIAPIQPHKFHERQNTANSTELRPTYSYGLSILPGYRFDRDLRAYIRVGGIVTRFNAIKKERGGFQIGPGVEAFLDQCLRVRAEYIYTHYHRVSGLHRLKMEQFSLGIVFAF